MAPASTETDGRRRTRAEQRVATRSAILDATLACLVDDGYAGLSTRAIAERAGIAQSTLMHHFPTRDALLVETVTKLAMQTAERTLDAVDLSRVGTPAGREQALDQVWQALTSPPALAAAQLWAAVWTEPDLAPTLGDIEQRLMGIVEATAAAFVPDLVDDPRLPALLDAVLTLIRGLIMARPAVGAEAVEARWQAMKPFLLQSAERLLADADADAA